MCSPKVLLLVFILFAFIFCTTTHSHLAGRKYFSYSHRRYEIFMFFFQPNSSPLFFITRSGSFSVIHVGVDIKNNVEKDWIVAVFSPQKAGWPCDFPPKTPRLACGVIPINRPFYSYPCL